MQLSLWPECAIRFRQPARTHLFTRAGGYAAAVWFGFCDMVCHITCATIFMSPWLAEFTTDLGTMFVDFWTTVRNYWDEILDKLGGIGGSHEPNGWRALAARMTASGQ